MATYDSLTDEQKTILGDFTNQVRSWVGTQARANNYASSLDSAYSGAITTILALVDSGETIPNASGLAGAASLTQAEVITLVSHFQNILTDMSSHTSGFDTATLRQAWAKAAGSENLRG